MPSPSQIKRNVGIDPERKCHVLARKIRRSLYRGLSINILRTPNAIFVGKTSGNSAWGGTKVVTVFCVGHAALVPINFEIMFPIPSGRRYPYPCSLQRPLARFELARKNSQKPFSSNVPAASSRTACAAASSLAVNR
jgi:hypothetical protein